MTFAQPFDLRAGLPTLYLVLATSFSLLLQVFLAVNWLQGNLDALWFWFSLILTITTLAFAYYFNKRQRSFYLHWQDQSTTYKLHSKNNTQKLDASLHSYTIQTGRLIFTSFNLKGRRKKYLLFHQALNKKNAFRRFKVRLCWTETDSSKDTAKHPD